MTSEMKYRVISKDQIDSLLKVINYKNKHAITKLVNDIQTEQTNYDHNCDRNCACTSKIAYIYRSAGWSGTKMRIDVDIDNNIEVRKYFDYQEGYLKYSSEKFKIDYDGIIKDEYGNILEDGDI